MALTSIALDRAPALAARRQLGEQPDGGVEWHRQPKRREIELVAVTKRFGDTVAVDDVSLRIPARRLLLPARAQRLRQDDDPAHDRRARSAYRGDIRIGGNRSSASRRCGGARR